MDDGVGADGGSTGGASDDQTSILNSMASTLGPRHGAVPAMNVTTPASTTLFRRLTWEGTVPLEVRVDSKELPANSNRGLECYFVQAARVSYLPLLVPDIKKFLVDVVLDEEGGKILKEEDWWFEAEDGSPLKWCVDTIFPCSIRR